MSQISLFSILQRSLRHRKARGLAALLAMSISAAVATALLTLYSDLDTKLHREFRRFGANVVITGRNKPNTLPPGILQKVLAQAGPNAVAAEFAYAVATTDRGTPVVIAGTDFPDVRRLNTWWQVDSWPLPTDGSVALLGQRAADFVTDEHQIQLTFSDRPITLRGSGRLRTGGEEDSRIFIPLTTFKAWTETDASVIELQIPGDSASVESVISRLRQTFPELEIKPLRQLVEGENRIVGKTRSLMFASVLLISLTVAVSVLATLSASVLERRRDFALMKVLGGSQRQIIGLFLLEALILALAGVALGYVLGSASAFVISQLNFHTSTLPRLSVVPLVIALNIVIAALAAMLPTRVLRSLQPAALLKGD